jgi:hypothetical protein
MGPPWQEAKALQRPLPENALPIVMGDSDKEARRQCQRGAGAVQKNNRRVKKRTRRPKIRFHFRVVVA